jgi:hypothetical protein
MSRRGAALAATILCALAALAPASASAAAAPGWTLAITPLPANFAPGHESEYAVLATNVGEAPTSGGEIEVSTTVPAGLTISPSTFNAHITDPNVTTQPECKVSPDEHTLTCKSAAVIHPGFLIRIKAGVKVPPGAPKATLEGKATVSGGGAAQDVSASAPTAVQPEPVPFDFLPGFNAPATDESANPQTLGGAHPYQQTISFSFPTKNPGDELTNDGHPRDIYVELPRGMVGSPAASEVLCTEAQLIGTGCPDASQIGVVAVTSLGGDVGISDVFTSNLYNMVPPPGQAANIGTNVANIGVFVHILASVRSEGDYGIEAATHDVIAFGTQPIFGVQAQIWGAPTAEAHTPTRGRCATFGGEECKVSPRQAAFLTMPSHCPAHPSLFEVLADTWEEPAPEFGLYATSYESADLAGNEVALKGCGELDFEPTIEARPTTTTTDSPSGLDVTLKQPQDSAYGSRSTAALKDATIRFPAGLAVNPSQAAGLGVCGEDQIGFLAKEGKTEKEEEGEGQEGAEVGEEEGVEGEEQGGEGGLSFSAEPQICPAAAKIGTVEVTSPLLVARDSAHKVEEKEGKPVPEALHGSLYIAKPFQNPFGSFLAVYLAIEDQKTGIVAKLAGRGELDPSTGQITTTFTENPELPIEEFKVHVFGGPRGALITPPTCEAHTTEARFTPWSAPEGKDKFPSAAFSTTQAPGGGACPAAEAQMPNAPKLSAGSESPAAGKYSPLLFKVSREDGTQRLGRLEARLPKGLTARLAGVGICSEAAIAKAHSREAPEKGAAELADPSCPASSRVGVVNASAGAGPTPYYTQGHAYLAGPYKGAPLSLVAIAPAIAGPFDLGTVVVRSAVYLDPETGQARVLSDPLPSILEGVPLDVRSVAVRADRPGFSLNPTSCARKSFTANATSTLGAVAPLSERFQVGGCKSLPYKPKLTARLFGPIHRGGHPRLRTVFTAKPGEANTARISFALPRSEFIDQSHFRTICTRVQFAANQCPAGSIYGYVKATSPLVDYTVEGPIYLRSSSHKLPDVVAALRGPPSQPSEVDLDGRVDSVNGGIRTTFEAVPDLPVSKAIVSLQGGKKGLFQNSTNICKGSHRATLKLEGQNGKVSDTQPLLKAQCAKKGKGGGKGKGKGAKGGGSKHR